MKKIILFSFISFYISHYISQENLSYQSPPKEILALANAQPAPSVLIDDKGENILLRFRDSYSSIANLSETEVRLAGLRINPITNISSRQYYYTNLKLQKSSSKEIKPINGLPENPRLSNFSWSADQTKIAFTNTSKNGVELWFLDVRKENAVQLTEGVLNANMGAPFKWLKDGRGFLIKVLPSSRKPLIDAKIAVPTGPTISISNGEKAQNRTYQDLLKNKDDEFNFEQLAKAQIKRIDLEGNQEDWAPVDMYRSISLSPDGQYVMVAVISRPFSYLVPYYRFPVTTNIYTIDGKKVKKFNYSPLTEVLPKGFMSCKTGKRNIGWRKDEPATIFWCEALDSGDPSKEASFRDEIFEVSAPFNEQPKSLIKLKQRFSSITWSNKTVAIASDYWWNTRNTTSYLFNPSNNNEESIVIENRNYQDRYSDPGNFVLTKNKFGQNVLKIENGRVYRIGQGYTKKGQFPFIDEFEISSQKSKRIYLSNYSDRLENIVDAVDTEKGLFLVRIESATNYPNYFIRNINKKNSLEQLTFFENPFKSIQDVHKQVINYKRYDSLDLSGTLYLPVGYDVNKKEKVPLILWAYPREYKDKSSAGQSTANPNKFTYPYYGSMIYWVTQGYAVLDGAAFPIVGEGDQEPNDTFIEQLVGNAAAAIKAVNQLGYIDTTRVAVGGHSYGAFMTANLLTHSNLFAAGIARSGAYNRTLTPFGFQSEERSYWDSPITYNTMSPFMNAHKMNHPLLLIHGEADNNSGTYPMQSERYFNALKGLGATARLVVLPKESHGYKAKESIMHMLWEQDQWLEKYVKNKKIN